MGSRIVTALCFTAGLICIYHGFFTPPRPGGPNNPGNIFIWFFYAFWCFGIGLQFAKVTDFEIHLTEGKYRKIKRFLTVRIEPWRYFNNISAILVKEERKERYKVTIWYYGTRRACVIKFDSSQYAMEFATHAKEALAAPLEVDLKKPE